MRPGIKLKKYCTPETPSLGTTINKNERKIIKESDYRLVLIRSCN
jgi:hypothetical protein